METKTFETVIEKKTCYSHKLLYYLLVEMKRNGDSNSTEK